MLVNNLKGICNYIILLLYKYQKGVSEIRPLTVIVVYIYLQNTNPLLQCLKAYQNSAQVKKEKSESLKLVYRLFGMA